MDSGAPPWTWALSLLLLWSTAEGAFLTTRTPAATTCPKADHIQVEPRTDVVLLCEAPEGTDLEELVLDWSRSDIKQSYVFLFRDGRPTLLNQHPHYKGRVELVDPTLRSGNLSIKLQKVGPSDSGCYECHIFKPSRVRKRSVYNTEPIKTINLTVAVQKAETEALPRKEVELTEAKSERLSQTSGALRLEAGFRFMAAVLVSLFLQKLE